MLSSNRAHLRTGALIALALAIIAFGFHEFGDDRPAEASRLAQDPLRIAQNPTYMKDFSYQGILRDVDGSLITGPRDIRIAIYVSATGNTPGTDMLGQETFEDVPVRDGVFNVVLTGFTEHYFPVMFRGHRYLGIKVGDDPEMVPRQKVYPVPLAMNAYHALESGGLSAGASVTGLTVNGSLNVPHFGSSTAAAKPGDVVVLQPRGAGEPTVQRSRQPYADHLMGVVSSNPGLAHSGGETTLADTEAGRLIADETVVAVAGRVPVRISLENGAIAAGDPLASASVPGAAMKATQAGQIIGYALQSSDEMQDGTILTWLQMGYYVPPEMLSRLNGDSSAGAQGIEESTALDLQGEFDRLREENAALVERLEALEEQR